MSTTAILRGHRLSLLADNRRPDRAPAEERTRHARYYAAAAVQIPAVGTYKLDPAASTVTFATRHLFGLAPVKGTFRLISGLVTIADPVTSSTASAVIDAASFDTGNPRRDQDVKSARLLHVNDHPQITFRSTELVQDGAVWRLRGQITARGTSAPAELTITEAATSEDVLQIRATTRVDRYAHGLTKAKDWPDATWIWR